METLTIGELADRAGVKVATIRYYERRGLLPEPPRDPNGYRRYTDTAVSRLSLVRRAQDFGFTLSEIADLLAVSQERAESIRARAEQKLVEVDGELERMEAVRDRLRRLVSACAEGEDECLRLIPERGKEGHP